MLGATLGARRQPSLPQRSFSSRTAQRRLSLPDAMLPGGLDEGGNAFRSIERDHARIGIGLDGSLREHRRSSGDMADDLEMPEGVAQPVDRPRPPSRACRRPLRDGSSATASKKTEGAPDSA